MAKAAGLCALAAMMLPHSADAFSPALALRNGISWKSPAMSGLRGRSAARAGGVQLAMQEKKESGFQISPWLRTDTRGGALVWTAILIILPFVVYGPITDAVGDELQAGRIIAGTYLVGVCILWTFSYVFRVGTKDMTYSKQLKAYEDAVIAKRFEELQEDEVDALMNSLEDPNPKPTKFTPGPDDKTPRGSGWRPDQY